MKKLFNFYLDDNIKEAAIKKLEDKMGKREKGAFASLIRVMLNDFVLNKDDAYINELIKLVETEYAYSQLKNKRSTM